MNDGLLLVNLGTPAAPTAPAVRAYLAEFLSDPRVVGIPRLLWLPILHGVILRVRPAKSAEKYAAVWTDEGSPLMVHTARQAAALAARAPFPVEYAMRYGEPRIDAALARLRAQGCTRVRVLPLYPQYSGSTTGSVLDAVDAVKDGPACCVIESYHDHPAYISALAAGVRRHWAEHGQPPELVMSFHGLPQRAVDLGDPYARQCRETAQALAAKLGLGAHRWRLTFQSRFGPARWLQPYTEPTLADLARGGIRRVDVICPGFVSDCLETLEEIALGARDAFLAAGGETFHLIPCLNEAPEWIAALEDVALTGDCRDRDARAPPPRPF